MHYFTAIQQEKGKQQLISGIENFDPAKLKHAETLEKNPLPTKEGSYTLSALSPLLNLFIIDAESSFITVDVVVRFSNRCREDSCLRKSCRMHKGIRNKETENGDSSLLPFSISVTFHNNYSYIAKQESANAKHCVNRNPMIILILTAAIGRFPSGEIERRVSEDS